MRGENNIFLNYCSCQNIIARNLILIDSLNQKLEFRVTLKFRVLTPGYTSLGIPIAGCSNFSIEGHFSTERNKIKICSPIAEKFHTRVIINSTLGSTLGSRVVKSTFFFDSNESK